MRKRNFATKKYLLIMFCLSLFSCEIKTNENHAKLNQIDSLNDSEITEFITSIIRYVGRKPEDATVENRFHTYFDKHYENQIQLHELDFYFASGHDSIYFAVSKIAPSLKLKKVSVGGVLLKDENGEISYYKEYFRTWKMTPEDLNEKTKLLFSEMVNGNPLNIYYTHVSGNMDFIEFPSDEVSFDVESRSWVTERTDVLKEFTDQKELQTQSKLDDLDAQSNIEIN